MPLNLPNLDDRRYEDLVEEARNLIVTLAPQWTNHNPSDPGITLVELFAYYTEMLIYRLNRVTDANKRMFLKLLRGSDSWTASDYELSGDKLVSEIRKTVLDFRTVDRAVTAEDFEKLSAAADPGVARVHCVPRRNLTSANLLERSRQNPGHVSVIVVPRTVFDKVGIQESGSYTDFTKAAGEGSCLGFRLVTGTGGFLYLGLASKFGEVQFQFLEAGRNYQLLFEYFDGSRWKKLTKDNDVLADQTANWTVNGSVRFNPPDDWIVSAIITEENERFWMRISSSSTPAIAAVVTRITPKIRQPDAAIVSNVMKSLDERRLLTTVVHVVGPEFISISVRLTIVIMPDALETAVLNRAMEALWNFFSPLSGGDNGRGWPFGRAVYVSEIYALLDTIAGVDYVCRSRDTNGNTMEEIVIESESDSRYQRNDEGELESVKLYENELVDITFPPGGLTVLTRERFLERDDS